MPTIAAATRLNLPEIYAFYNELVFATSANKWSINKGDGQLGTDCSYFQKGSFECNGVKFSVDQNFLCQRLGDNAFRCHFVGSELGRGSFAQVYPVEAVVDVTPASYEPCGGYAQKMVIKQQCHCNCSDQLDLACKLCNSIDNLKAEYLVSCKVPYLEMQQPQVVRKNEITTSYTVMAEMPGTQFFNILQKDHDKSCVLTLEQRMELTLKLYKALQEISNLGIIHRDLKPENIMVTMNPIGVKFVDYGFAKTIPDGKNKIKVEDFSGTPSYISPEMLKVTKSISSAADLYSLTRVLLILWGAIDHSFDGELSKHMFFMKKVDKLQYLLKKIPENQDADLRKFDLIKDIRRLFSQGLDTNVNFRVTVEDAVKTFEAIYLKYKAATQIDNMPLDFTSHAAEEEVEEDDDDNDYFRRCAIL